MYKRQTVIKKPADQCSDSELFQREMADVAPLKKSDTIESRAAGRSRRPTRMDARAVEIRQASVLPVDGSFDDHSADDSTHRKNGVQLRLLQKLKRGRFKPVDQLDLHSMSITEGQAALLHFIHDSSGNKLACIRIIHGKGLRSAEGPKLKNMARQLLRDHPHVLAYTACKPAEGGDGATDVLLRSS